jgi:mannose-6-phosphate isomerase-like protein (cupin superfamily)
MLFGVMLAPVFAGDPAGFVYWHNGAPPEGGPKGAKFDNHALSISHRDKSGQGEVHQNQTDIMVIQSGEATITVGGELVDGQTVRPGELLGTSIKGGVTKTITPGDVLHIPAGTPHQMLLEPGKQITYFVVKVDNK